MGYSIVLTSGSIRWFGWIFIAVIMIGCTIRAQESLPADPSSTVPEFPPTPDSTDGSTSTRLFLMDPSANNSALTSIIFTIQRIQVRQPAGWTIVSSTHQQYDLIAMKEEGILDLVAIVNFTPRHDQFVCMNISRVMILHEANSTGGDLQIEGTLRISTNTTRIIQRSLSINNVPFNDSPVVKMPLATLKNTPCKNATLFDFKAHGSLRVTGEKAMNVAPIIKPLSK